MQRKRIDLLKASGTVLLLTAVLSVTGCTSKNDNISEDSKEVTVSEKENYEDTSKENLAELYNEEINLKKPDIDEAGDFKKSLENKSVIMNCKEGSKDHEVYNIDSLDKFIDSFNSGKEAYVRVIKGIIRDDGSFLVNKLDEYETDGKVIRNITYDTYADKNEFTPGTPVYSYKIVKHDNDEGVRYEILMDENTAEGMGETVMSFKKSSLQN